MYPLRQMLWPRRTDADPSPLAALLLLGALMTMSVTVSACGVFGSNEEDDDSSEEEPTALAAPSSLEATSGNSQIGLDWEAVSEADTYNVYRSTSSTSGTSGDPLAEGVSQASYTDDSAENGTTYYYRVTAVGSEGTESDGSDEVEATPFDEPPSRP